MDTRTRGTEHAAQRAVRAERKTARHQRDARHGKATRRMVRETRPEGRQS